MCNVYVCIYNISTIYETVPVSRSILRYFKTKWFQLPLQKTHIIFEGIDGTWASRDITLNWSYFNGDLTHWPPRH